MARCVWRKQGRGTDEYSHHTSGTDRYSRGEVVSAIGMARRWEMERDKQILLS